MIKGTHYTVQRTYYSSLKHNSSMLIEIASSSSSAASAAAATTFLVLWRYSALENFVQNSLLRLIKHRLYLSTSISSTKQPSAQSCKTTNLGLKTPGTPGLLTEDFNLARFTSCPSAIANTTGKRRPEHDELRRSDGVQGTMDPEW
ncbi:protein kinase superfamily protein [Striga asiatica]|uniref:Protein kinase superfamily protein n=1 Tax=Striga asiatica TaxID=4170 RepID=A0A5A7PCX6_STRAF|nr:protein kinase superfamily protein [Striga asiatica]